MCHDETKGSGSVEFRVITNGKPLWSSGVMRGKQPAKEVDTDVSGLKTLILQVGDAGDGIDHDHADWARRDHQL
ncbi:MAG: NPCBM/NEW2 domain-containing protein [Isosphaeraceae bacterium]